MRRGIQNSPDVRVLVQFVPHAFGWKAMNLPLCVWLAARYRNNLSVMFHEVSSPLGREQSLRHNLLGVVTRTMALTLAGSGRQVMVATPAWQQLLAPTARAAKIKWTPVPSNVPVIADSAGVDATRSRFVASNRRLIGHFGTYGTLVAESLMRIFVDILSQDRDASMLLLGRGGDNFRSRLLREHPDSVKAERVHATDGLDADDLSRHIAACDVFVQYYPEGVTCRRGSVMALLAHGRPVATTCGPITESLWRESGAVAMVPAGNPAHLARLAVELAADGLKRSRLESAASALYDQRFDIRHTLAALRGN